MPTIWPIYGFIPRAVAALFESALSTMHILLHTEWRLNSIILEKYAYKTYLWV